MKPGKLRPPFETVIAQVVKEVGAAMMCDKKDSGGCPAHAHVVAANPPMMVTYHKRKGGTDARYYVCNSLN